MIIEHSKSGELKLPKAMLDKIEKLPALPQVVGKIQQLIGTDQYDAKKISQLIETDQPLPRRFLKFPIRPNMGLVAKFRRSNMHQLCWVSKC